MCQIDMNQKVILHLFLLVYQRFIKNKAPRKDYFQSMKTMQENTQIYTI